MSKYIVVDVESDGPIIGTHSIVCFGAVILDRNLDKTFYGQTSPISNIYDPESLAISGFSREDHMKFDYPMDVIPRFAEWVKEHTNSPVFLSDNNGYDASWINYYLHVYNNGHNPFGWSSRRIGDLFCGYFNDPFYKWKKHRISDHNHHPISDAKGNAEAVLWLIDQGFKLKI